MSQPINIPGQRSHQSRNIREDRSFAEDGGPYFGYIEILESGEVLWAVSSGYDKYVTVGPRQSLPSLAFIVERDLQTKTITIEIASPSLRESIYSAILHLPSGTELLDLGFDALLQNYDALKLHSELLDARNPCDDDAEEMRLLVKDLLLDTTLYDGIGVEQFRNRGALCVTHLEDIHQRNLDIGLDEIEDCFVLGVIPDELNDVYLDALNIRYAEVALSGDIDALHNLCEPIVRSGEIALQYNPSLLTEVLDKGYFDTYLYLLDLVYRTRENPSRLLDYHDLDVTLDPFCVAIRLDRYDVVQPFVRDKAFFEGHVCDDASFKSGCHVFTPLSAAVFWERPRIVRLLLRASPIYLAGYQSAVTLARNNSMDDILAFFAEHERRSAPDTVLNASIPQDQLQEPPVPAQYQFHGMGAATAGDAQMGRSVSEITNSLAGSQTPTSTMQKTYSLRTDELIDPQLLLSPGVFAQPGEPPANRESSLQFCLPSTSEALPTISEQNLNEKPFARQRSTHTGRRKLGQSLVHQLDSRCARLRAFCGGIGASAAYENLMSDFTSMENVWEAGIENFRQITRNKAPTTLVQVLQCLVVADALSNHLSPLDDRLHSQFINDIGRWKTLLSDDEKPMFDDIAKAMWDIHDVSALSGSDMRPDELYHFQELIQNLISPQGPHNRSPSKKYMNFDTRLRSIRKQILDRKRDMESNKASRRRRSQDSAPFRNIGAVLGRLTKDTDSVGDDDIDLGDFIHLDALQAESTEGSISQASSGLLPRTPWKDIDSTVVFLLASMAFAIVLIMVSAIRNGLGSDLMRTMQHSQQGGSWPCGIVEDFLDFKGSGFDGYEAPVWMEAAKIQKKTSLIATMKTATERGPKPALFSQSLPTPVGSHQSISTLRASLSSPSYSGSSFLASDFSSDTGRPALRLRCLSAKCPKTFSSVSNRNKHMREGCPFRDKKGYPCRNESCSKVLTTKWYRNTHEQSRCRFR